MLLISRADNRQVVVQACDRAVRAGVRAGGGGVKPGMSLAHARALLPGDAIIQPHRPEQDDAALQALSRWAWRFTPIVQPNSPDGLLLEISGCEHLFGGTRAMLDQVVRQMHQLGLQVRGAIGPTVGGAWALARWGRSGTMIESVEELAEALAPLPVQALRVEDEVAEGLRAVAVETVGELRALSRSSLAERFGEMLLLRLDQAMGRAFEAVEPIEPSEPVWAERVFAGPVTQLEGVVQTGRELVSQLCDQLAQRESGARQLQLELERPDAEDLHETITLSRPSRDVRHLWTLLRPKLERVHMGFGIERMRLQAGFIGRLPHQQRSAEAWRDEDEAQPLDREIGELIDQYVARLGGERVSVVETKPTHVPEQVFAHRPVAGGQAAGHRPAEVIDADRPTLLYKRPQPVQVVLLSPEGPVMTMRRGGESVRIVSSVGPERITPRWWLVGGDSRKPQPRDYYKVQDEHGRWWWLYRQAGTSHWFLHGRWY